MGAPWEAPPYNTSVAASPLTRLRPSGHPLPRASATAERYLQSHKP